MTVDSFQSFPPTGLPRMIIRGESQTLNIKWFINNVLQTATITGGTLTLKNGPTVILDNVAVTSFGVSSSATYDLLAADIPITMAPNDTMLELWTLNTALKSVTVRRSGHLVVTKLWPMITDSDLTARHRRLDDFLPPGATTWSEYIGLAWEVLNRDLIKKGRRPELILDSYALIDAHVFKTLELIFRDQTTLVGDGRYREFAIMYGESYVAEWEVIQFRYDRDNDDAIGDGENESASPSIWFGVPPGFPSSLIRGGK